MKSMQDVKTFIDQSIDSLSERNIYIALNKQVSIPESDQKLLECEKQCMFFRFEKGDVLFRAYNDEARNSEYPSFDMWDEDYYTYILVRAQSVTHHKLIARYNQVLFNGAKKYRRQEQAQKSIDAYINIIESGQYDVWPEGEQDEWSYVNLFSNLIGLSIKINNYRESDIKALIKHLLTHKLAAEKEFQHFLIQTLLDFPKMFKAPDFEGLEEMLIEDIRLHWDDHNYFTAPLIIKTGIQVAQKRQTDEKRWFEMLGKNDELWAEHRSNDMTGIIPLMKLHEAMDAYQKAGNKQKVDELGARYAKLSENLKLTRARMRMFKGMEDQMTEKLNQQVQTLLDAGAERAWDWLKYELELPDEDFLIHISKNKGNVFKPKDTFGLYAYTEFDINKNIKAPAETPEDKHMESLRNAYILHENAMVRPFLYLLFLRGIQSKVLSSESLLKNLSETWIDTELIENSSDGSEMQYNWIELLKPGLEIFFNEIEKAIHTEGYEPQIVPAIDSLVLKCEGMLRDLAWALDENTKKINRKHGMQEKTLEDLLSLPKLKEIIDPTDLLFFRYIYTSFGLNLRNYIGHGFFRAYHYSPHYGYLIILSILRFARYEVTQNAQ